LEHPGTHGSSIAQRLVEWTDPVADDFTTPRNGQGPERLLGA
jgi:hypothetical protein